MSNIKHGDPQWFVHDRFGMFIHWGLYSLPARHEWVQRYEFIPTDVYAQYARYFKGDHFDPKAWAAAAKAAGMKYFVFTTKHHDGFCMFKTATTTYNSVDATPSKRDYVKELSDACRRGGINFAIYFFDCLTNCLDNFIAVIWHFRAISFYNNNFIHHNHLCSRIHKFR